MQVAVAGAGTLNDLRVINERLAVAVSELLGPRSGTSAWISATPFVPPRHLKKRGRASLIGQVEQELAHRGLPPARIEVLPWDGDTIYLRHFVRNRLRGPRAPVDAGFAVRLEFERAVSGPICLGYGCHFGLGRFRAPVGAADLRSATAATGT